MASDFVTGDKINSHFSGKIILHVDLDAFFASCEEARNPSLKGKPVVIGSDPKGGKGRGVVSTANYEARKYGIVSAMPISWAYRRCKFAVFLRGDGKLYSEVSRRIFTEVGKLGDKFERAGIDEGYMDVSSGGYEGALEIVHLIKKIVSKEKITCSVGIGPNKLISKIGSDFKKPNGVTVVKDGEVGMFMSPLKIEKVPGIGPKTAFKLHRLGIYKVGKLAKVSEERLKERFGESWGGWLYRVSRGIGSTSIGVFRERKSIGAERTFYSDVGDRKKVLEKLDTLCEKIYVKTELKFKTVMIKIRYADFETHACQKSNKEGFSGVSEIKKIARGLLGPFLEDVRKIRLIGVRYSGFRKD
jgi:DNA polymerase IV (archaeal DinB-like DNA polymerase)